MDTIKWGIIGCGEVTEMKSGPAFNKVKNSSLVAVMRRDAEKAKDYAKRHNVPKWYSDADEIINDPEINAIYIATPPVYHEQYTINALKAGKFVYVEKPMALNAHAAKRMEIAQKHYHGKLAIAHYRREHPFFKKIKNLLEEKTIGDIKFVRLEFFRKGLTADKLAISRNAWRVDPSTAGGGLFYDLAPHQLDLMQYLFGEPEKAIGFSVNQSKIYNADDCTIGSILFKSNILFNGIWCFDHHGESKDYCEITGSRGTIEFSVFGKQSVTIRKGELTETLSFETPIHVQQPLIQKVVEYFLGISENPSTATNGVSVMKLMGEMTNK